MSEFKPDTSLYALCPKCGRPAVEVPFYCMSCGDNLDVSVVTMVTQAESCRIMDANAASAMRKACRADWLKLQSRIGDLVGDSAGAFLAFMEGWYARHERDANA